MADTLECQVRTLTSQCLFLPPSCRLQPACAPASHTVSWSLSKALWGFRCPLNASARVASWPHPKRAEASGPDPQQKESLTTGALTPSPQRLPVFVGVPCTFCLRLLPGRSHDPTGLVMPQRAGHVKRKTTWGETLKGIVCSHRNALLVEFGKPPLVQAMKNPRKKVRDRRWLGSPCAPGARGKWEYAASIVVCLRVGEPWEPKKLMSSVWFPYKPTPKRASEWMVQSHSTPSCLTEKTEG